MEGNGAMCAITTTGLQSRNLELVLSRDAVQCNQNVGTSVDITRGPR